jgi:hypothetical protein
MNSKNNLKSDLTKSMSMGKSRFTEMLLEENDLDQSGFDCWVFCHGMLFSSPDKWWGDYSQRDYPHEGVDLQQAKGVVTSQRGRVFILDME